MRYPFLHHCSQARVYFSSAALAAGDGPRFRRRTHAQRRPDSDVAARKPRQAAYGSHCQGLFESVCQLLQFCGICPACAKHREPARTCQLCDQLSAFMRVRVDFSAARSPAVIHVAVLRGTIPIN